MSQHIQTQCKVEHRRDLVRDAINDRRNSLNGLDYLDVSSDQTTLTVYFLGRLPSQLRKDNPNLTRHVRVTGGRRITDIQVVDVDPVLSRDSELDDCMIVRLNKAGDFSTYSLCLVDIPNIDPHYNQIEFTFKVDCPTDLDCASTPACPPAQQEEPLINYLAKDYASFRQLILDRLALITPDWRERHVPDLNIALVELLAYTGDSLSYYQDAVATEAYLDTARQRISVRRHARLVDYVLHEGCNARAWVQIEAAGDLVGADAIDPERVFFITSVHDPLLSMEPMMTDARLTDLPAGAYETFEPVDRVTPIELRVGHNQIPFYTWGNRECCLPRHSTSATLLDSWIYNGAWPRQAHAVSQPSQKDWAATTLPPLDESLLSRKLDLKVGEVLVFEEICGPKTGQLQDANPLHRHAVRLTRVTPGVDKLIPANVFSALTGTLLEPHDKQPMQHTTPVVEIEWAAEDALPFPLCLSAMTLANAKRPCQFIDSVSVARGNVVLVDHGATQPLEKLGTVGVLERVERCECPGKLSDVIIRPKPFRPALSQAPLTHGVRPVNWASATGAVEKQDPHAAIPLMRVLEIPPARHGKPMTEDALAAEVDMRIHWLIRSFKYGDVRTQAVLAWEARSDLLNSGPDDRHFVVETDNDGIAWLRFGNDELGEMPKAGSTFVASYRTGNGVRGNVGAGAISHLIVRGGWLPQPIKAVRNPMPAQGGFDPELMNEARLYAPSAFRAEIKRAITAEDYATLAQKVSPAIQRASAELVWTGSWYEADVAIDARGTNEPAPALLQSIQKMLKHNRRMGHDLVVLPAQFVPLDIAMQVWVKAGYQRGHVKAALLDAFSSRRRANGQPGFFHPDKLTFGDGIYLSQLIEAAKAVPGVEDVIVTRLQRLHELPNHELENGVLPLGPMEVARLDNDADFPENGTLTLE